jgi:hypothetical protein
MPHLAKHEHLAPCVCPRAGEYVRNVDGSYVEAPETPGDWDTGFPRSGSSVMLALTPENDYKSVDIVVFGGQKNGYECPHVQALATTTLGGRTSYRMTITWEEAGVCLHSLSACGVVCRYGLAHPRTIPSCSCVCE